ncbi:MAG: hypothetical protein HW378_2726 [Anaerolineales bacterium]|nr:hypothetical protein [Anaerolineales bacterium]
MRTQSNTSPARIYLWLGLITLLAGALRFHRIGSLPPGLWFDEAWIALKARDVLAARSFQLYFDQFGMGGMAFPMIYLTALARVITGNDPLAVRYAVAAVSVLNIPLTFFALRAIFRLDGEPEADVIGGAKQSQTGGREIAPDAARPRNDRSTRAALLGALVLGLTFPHLLLSRVGFDVILPAITGSLTFLGLAVASRTGRARDYVLTGAALGASVYGYSSGRFLPVAVAIAVVWLALLARDWRRRVTGLALAAAASIVVALPLGAYFLLHPGAFAVRAQTTTYNTLGPGAKSVPLAVLNNLVRTLASFSLPGFGDVMARHNIPGHPVFDPFLSLIFWLGVVTVVISVRRRSVALLASWAGVMLLPVVLTDGAPVFTRLLGATPALAGVCVLGGLALFDALAPRSARAASVIVGFGLLFSLTVSAYNYFVRWATDPRLYDAFQVGDWEAAALARDRAGAGSVYLSPELINDSHPTFDLLLRGSPVRTLPINCLAYFDRPARPVTYIVEALNDNSLLENLSAQFPTGQRGDPILHQPEPFPLYETFVVPAGAEAVDPPIATTGTFGTAVRLIGYSLSPATARPGDTLALTLYWQAATRPEADYTSFIHLFAPEAETSTPAAQSDSPPCGGDYPTPRWAPGEIVADARTLTVPADYAANSARLAVGMYAWPSSDRLPITGTDAALPDGRLLLTEIPIVR